MNRKQIRDTVAKYQTKPGYILDLTRIQFENIFWDVLDIDIMSDQYADLGDSVGKRFTSFLTQSDNKSIYSILDVLDSMLD